MPLSRGLIARNAVLMLLTLLAALPALDRPTVLATLFVLGLYQTANLWLAHQPKLLELRNAP
ncbi:hypothetical protein ACU6VG_18475 (plasmid) [Sphaerotilus sulfidivorans]